MNLISRLRRENIPVSWSTILVGWSNEYHFPRLLSARDVSDFALSQIDSQQVEKPELAVLASVKDLTADDIERSLRKLCADLKTDVELEERKWRLAAFDSLTSELSEDPLYGTLAILEFWNDWGMPAIPPVTYLKKFTLDPEYAYSTESFDKTKRVHSEWFAAEASSLRDCV